MHSYWACSYMLHTSYRQLLASVLCYSVYSQNRIRSKLEIFILVLTVVEHGFN
jgi:hypothetical protein